MHHVRTLHTKNTMPTTNVIIARTIRNDKDLFMREEDLRVLLKLRKNRLRIGSLSQDLLIEEEISPGNFTEEEALISNLKAINRILDGVKNSLNQL